MGLKYANADHTTIFDDSRNMHIPCSAGNTQFDEIEAAGTAIADYVAPAATWDSVRAERNQLLKDTDWQAAPDSPDMTDGQKTYRQALRDLPATNADPTKIVFPDAP